MNGVLTVKEVATMLQVCRETVYRWLHKNKLRGYKIGGKVWRIRQIDLEAFLELEAGASQFRSNKKISR